MNQVMKNWAKTGKSKLKLSEEEENFYRAGLLLLSGMVCEEFLDLPRLSEDKYAKDGLFYSIPFLHDDMLGHSGRKRTLLVVWKIENRSSHCPFRIEIEVSEDKKDYSIYVFDQAREKTIKYLLCGKILDNYYTDIQNYNQLTLTQLMNTTCNVRSLEWHRLKKDVVADNSNTVNNHTTVNAPSSVKGKIGDTIRTKKNVSREYPTGSLLKIHKVIDAFQEVMAFPTWFVEGKHGFGNPVFLKDEDYEIVNQSK